MLIWVLNMSLVSKGYLSLCLLRAPRGDKTKKLYSLYLTEAHLESRWSSAIKIHELLVQIHKFKNHLISWTQVNSLNISSFPKILSPKSLENSWGNSSVQFQLLIWWNHVGNTNFEERDLLWKKRTSAQKSHPSPDRFGENLHLI